MPNLFEQIVDKDNFRKAYKKTLQNGGKYRREAMIFARDETYNLEELRQSLIKDTYELSGYIRFSIFEPKERVVDAPHYKDKIIQHALNTVLKELYMPSFIVDSYACLNGRGTHKCASRIQHFLRKAKWEYGIDAYIVKIDIKKFFYSIDRDVLKNLLHKKIKCKRTIKLLFKIIDSAGSIAPLGLPLGNTISQICANIYMDRLDQYAKRRLSLKYYVRYMDDCVAILPNKDTARTVLTLMCKFIKDVLHLQANKDKTKIFPILQGINIVGFKIYTTHRLLRDDCKKKIKRKVKAFPQLILNKRLSTRTAERILNSWKGHSSHACSYNFMLRLLRGHSFIYRQKDVLRVSLNSLEGDTWQDATHI